MKLKNSIFPFIKTIIFASVIIIAGYTILAKASNFIIRYDNKISPVAVEKNDSYIFYSQTDNDVTLFPWNYANDSVDAMTYSDFYLNNVDEFNYDITLSSIVDTGNLYDYLRYFFYRTVSPDLRKYMTANDISLSTVMDFTNLGNYVTVYSGSTTYFFYKGRINIDNYSFDLDFSFDSSGFLYSFQCQRINNSYSYTDEVMQNGNKVLSSLVSENNRDTLLLLVNDILFLNDFLKNYYLNISSSSDISVNLEEDAEISYDISINYTNDYYEKYIMDDSSYDYDIEELEKNREENYDKYFKYRDADFTNDDQNSYQIVKTKNEFLLILSDSNIVFHYDPLLRVFNGFNLSE